MKKILKSTIVLIFIIIILIVIINGVVILSTIGRIKENVKEKNIDCILVLGAGIRQNKPSPMLEDRLLTAIELYNSGITDKIIVSGDHRSDDYNEVAVMKNFLIDNGIPSKDIFMDHAGLSTYDSMYRAKKIFKADKVIVVTQKYHLYRALYVSKRLDIDVYGVSANKRPYQNQTSRDIREIFARIKDFVKCFIKPEPIELGEVHPVNGNGDDTNEK